MAAGLVAAPISSSAFAHGAPNDPDALTDASRVPETGVSLARQQITDNDLLAAAATLERVLLLHPDAATARLLYASILCRLDDRAGAEFEITLMKGRAAPDEARNEVAGACGSGALSSPRGGAKS
jgi:Flp pilus assembly protein TadD